MLALIAEVRLGNIRVPPECNFQDSRGATQIAWPWQLYHEDYLLRDVHVEGGPPGYHTHNPARRRGVAFNNHNLQQTRVDDADQQILPQLVRVVLLQEPRELMLLVLGEGRLSRIGAALDLISG